MRKQEREEYIYIFNIKPLPQFCPYWWRCQLAFHPSNSAPPPHTPPPHPHHMTGPMQETSWNNRCVLYNQSFLYVLVVITEADLVQRRVRIRRGIEKSSCTYERKNYQESCVRIWKRNVWYPLIIIIRICHSCIAHITLRYNVSKHFQKTLDIITTVNIMTLIIADHTLSDE